MFEQIANALGASVLAESDLAEFFRETPWVDHDADYARVAVVGRLSVWEEPDGRVYLVLGMPDGSPMQLFLDVGPESSVLEELGRSAAERAIKRSRELDKD